MDRNKAESRGNDNLNQPNRNALRLKEQEYQNVLQKFQKVKDSTTTL